MFVNSEAIIPALVTALVILLLTIGLAVALAYWIARVMRTHTIAARLPFGLVFTGVLFLLLAFIAVALLS